LTRPTNGLKDHGVAVTEIIERGYGKSFYFNDPNGNRLQIELKTKQDVGSLEGDPDPVRMCTPCCSGLSDGHGNTTK